MCRNSIASLSCSCPGGGRPPRRGTDAFAAWWRCPRRAMRSLHQVASSQRQRRARPVGLEGAAHQKTCERRDARAYFTLHIGQAGPYARNSCRISPVACGSRSAAERLGHGSRFGYECERVREPSANGFKAGQVPVPRQAAGQCCCGRYLADRSPTCSDWVCPPRPRHI